MLFDNETFFHFNATGSVIALTDSAGDTAEMYRYDVYGRFTVYAPDGQDRPASLYGNPYLFTGRRFDPETGLYYYRARMYNPTIGRFMQTDPIGYADGINWYLYCANNPVMLIDPSGELVETAWDIANIGIGAASLVSNVKQGKFWWAAFDVVGLAYDVTATAIPFLPGGASAGFKAARAGNTIVDSVNVGLDVAKIADKTHDAAKVADNAASAMSYGRRVHNTVDEAVEGSLRQLDNFAAGANRATGIQPDFPN